MGTTVLVVDMINDFVTGEFENERAQEIVPNVQTLLEEARSNNKPVVYVTDAHPEGDHQFSIWGEHAKKGTEESEVIPELEPKEEEHQLNKTKYSAFYNTDLEDILEKLETDKIVVSGVLTHLCVQHTAADAFFRGYDVIVPEGCVEDVTKEQNEKALSFIEKNYDAEVLEYDELIERW